MCSPAVLPDALRGIVTSVVQECDLSSTTLTMIFNAVQQKWTPTLSEQDRVGIRTLAASLFEARFPLLFDGVDSVASDPFNGRMNRSEKKLLFLIHGCLRSLGKRTDGLRPHRSARPEPKKATVRCKIKDTNSHLPNPNSAFTSNALYMSVGMMEARSHEVRVGMWECVSPPEA